MSKYTVFIKRIGLVAIVQTLASLKGLIVLPILTKTLGASDFGIYSQILVTVSLLQPFIQLGLDNSLLRFLSSKERGEIGRGVLTVLLVALINGIIVAMAILFLSDFLAVSLLKDSSAATAIRLGSLLLVLEVLVTIALGSFRIFGQIKRYSLVLLLQTFLEIGLIAFFVLSGNGVIGAIISLLITRGIMLVLMLFLIISHAGFGSPDFSILRPYLMYGLPLVPGFIFEFVVSLSDRYVIGFFKGAASVGIYSAAYGIGSIILMFTSYVIYILRPTVYKEYDEGKINEVKTYLSYSLKYLLMLSIPAACGLSILAKPMLNLLTTSEFISAGIYIIPLTALSMIFYGVEQIFGAVILMAKQTKVFLLAFGIAATINLGLNIVFVPRFGVVAAAITTLIAYTLLVSLIYYRSRRYIIFSTHPGFILKSILASIIMTLFIWSFSPVGMLGIILSITFGSAIYFIALFSLKGFTQTETHFLLDLVQRTMGIRNRQ